MDKKLRFAVLGGGSWATAIVKMPPKTIPLELVEAKSPTINPRVVITPEAIPKPKLDLKHVFFIK